MSDDKRTVTTDALETLGMIHFKQEARDAIHLAVEPVEAGEVLVRGDYINITNGIAHLALRKDALGIVDPFINGEIKKGQKFWFVMKPRLVQSLRHVWYHKDLPEKI